MTDRKSPNPNSGILKNAVVAGAGISLPPEVMQTPEGFGVVVLHVPLEHIDGLNAIELQADLGIPWEARTQGGAISGVWFDDIFKTQ